jgi:hypothetical protein
MPRSISTQRLTQLIEVATEIFIAQGYRQTQMADVAEALGVAKGDPLRVRAKQGSIVRCRGASCRRIVASTPVADVLISPTFTSPNTYCSSATSRYRCRATSPTGARSAARACGTGAPTTGSRCCSMSCFRGGLTIIEPGVDHFFEHPDRELRSLALLQVLLAQLGATTRGVALR